MSPTTCQRRRSMFAQISSRSSPVRSSKSGCNSLRSSPRLSPLKHHHHLAVTQSLPHTPTGKHKKFQSISTMKAAVDLTRVSDALTAYKQTPSPSAVSVADSGLGSSVTDSQDSTRLSITPTTFGAIDDESMLMTSSTLVLNHDVHPLPPSCSTVGHVITQPSTPTIKCKWVRCDCVLATMDELATHLLQCHIEPLQPSKSAVGSRSPIKSRFVCQWMNDKSSRRSMACGNHKRHGTKHDQYQWLREHVTSRHASNRNHRCLFDACVAWFSTQAQLAHHVNVVHVKPNTTNNTTNNEQPRPQKRKVRSLFIRKAHPSIDSMDNRTVNILMAALIANDPTLLANTKQKQSKKSRLKKRQR